MSIRLDWQVETDIAAERAGEDPAARRLRRRQRLAIIAFTLLLFVLAGGVVALIAWRLNTVDTTLRQGVINTARAEQNALKIGDLSEYMSLMRGGNLNYIPEQTARFNRYQDLKQKGAIQFSGNIDAEVDGQRGRALVEELINGQPTLALWYFWRYPDGWRHVPTDYTFWGETRTLENKTLSITYGSTDEAIAQVLFESAGRWWTAGCAALGCTTPPPLHIKITPCVSCAPRWDDADPNLLVVASPLATAADRAPLELSPDQEEAIAERLAEHSFEVASGALRPNANSDAAWLQQTITEWLTAATLGRGNPAQIGFIQSVRDAYGAETIPALVKALSPNSDISILGKVLGQPLNALTVDWRTFFQWRLALERELLKANNQKDFLALWDSGADALVNARRRLAQPGAALAQVQSVTLGVTAAGIPAALVRTTVNNVAASVEFHIVNGTWKRFA